MARVASDLLIGRIVQYVAFRHRPALRGVSTLYRAAIDRDVTLTSLEGVLADLCSTGWPVDRTWKSPCRRHVLHGAFEEEVLEQWLDAIPDWRPLVRLTACTMSKLLTFRYSLGEDFGESWCTVEAMPVFTAAVEVDLFWAAFLASAPAALRERLAAAQWLMRLLVARYNFAWLHAMLWFCSREGPEAGIEIAQFFFEDKCV
mmetsp:Transcript_135479/g.377325  ORF Transcript_135479/g.377325 Transcript_135479/m.377325 type:complete len:202 (-) Transcript_135479:49-654(-)